MELIMRKNLNNAVEQVLHVKGNYGGGILEMTLVVDCGLPKTYVKELSKDLASALKAHSEVFRNVRLNLLYFSEDERMENRVLPFSFLQMESCFAEYQQVEAVRSLDALSARLKLFHARSKLILVLTDKRLQIKDVQTVHENMLPFLGKKSLFLFQEDEEKRWLRGDRAEKMLTKLQGG